MNLKFDELMKMELTFDYHPRDLSKQTIVNDRFLLNHSNKVNLPRIAEFISNNTGGNVLITGATGFMGKVLIEKLLRCCADIQTIYLLMRTKKNVKQTERLENMLSLPLFDKLRQNYPEQFHKLKIICGDCMKLNLGISNSDRKLLKENVNIIFHAAASVRFDDPIKKAVLMNTRGTREIVALAKEMINLKVFVHISTSYCHTDKQIIDEIIYPPQANWRAIIKMAETMNSNILNILQPKILDHFPNTYTFSKSLAEDIVTEASTDIPTVIFRPSIVISSHADPIPGWIDNMNGPMGMIVGGGIGMIHAIYGDENVIADWIQVDIAINAMIASAWYQAHSLEENKKRCLVINACTSNTQPVSYKSLMDNSLKLTKIYPFNRVMWYPFILMTKSKLLHNLQVLLFHILPGLFLDLILKLQGEKLRLMKIYRKAYFSNLSLEYFMMNEWKFKNGHFMSLHNSLKEVDQSTFSIDFSKHNPIEVMRTDLFGLKKYLLKENPNFEETIFKAKSRLQKLFYLHYTTIIIICFITILILWQSRSYLQTRITGLLHYNIK